MSAATAEPIAHRDVTLDDFMTGLLAGLAAEHIHAVSIRGPQFYSAVEAAFREFERRGAEQGLRLRFWIALNRIHGDSADVREGITKAVQRDLISLDNPVYLDMRLKITAEDAPSYLETLPAVPTCTWNLPAHSWPSSRPRRPGRVSAAD